MPIGRLDGDGSADKKKTRKMTLKATKNDSKYCHSGEVAFVCRHAMQIHEHAIQINEFWI